MRRLVIAVLSVVTALALLAGPAAADHDHHLITPVGRCVTIPVAHQDHAPGTSWEPGSQQGAYFHSGVHIGATDESNRVLGKGNSRVHVFGGACA
jgi:hypothetical protein